MNSQLKKISGTVLGIGLSEKEENILEQNDKVIECYLLNSNSVKDTNSKGYSKIIDIRKIKKIFRKKSFDYIICNFEELRPYLRSFIKNSIYLNKSKIYYYNINDLELEELENRYLRYGSRIEKSKKIVIIDNSNSKTNIFKNVFFYLCDLIYDVIEYIGKILVN